MPRNTSSKNPLRNLFNLILTLVAIYSTLLSTVLLLRRRLSEDFKAIGLFNSFAHMLMLPTLVLLPLNLLFRPWSAWFQVIPVATFIAAYGRLFALRKPATEIATTRTIKILTFNLHGEAQLLEPILDILRTANADIISLQELSIEAADCFKTELIGIYPNQALYPSDQSSRGQGILSRYPITNPNFWRNPTIARNSLGHLRVEIDFDGTPIIVYNTHPLHPGMANDGFSTRPRGQEIDVVLELATADTGAVLIMGDFNMTDQNEDYQRITVRFRDSFHEVGVGMGFTFPDLSSFQSLPDYWPLPIRLFPFLRLDYIFHNASFRPISTKVLVNGWRFRSPSDLG